MALPQCCYLAKGAMRPSHTTNTIKFDRIPFDPCNSNKRFDLCPFDQKNSTYLQPPVQRQTNKTASEMLSQIQIIAISEAIQQKPITTIRLIMIQPKSETLFQLCEFNSISNSSQSDCSINKYSAVC